MTPDRWARVKEVFGAALERAPAERGAFVADVCAEDSDLRREIEGLLERHADAPTYLDRPAAAHLAGVRPGAEPTGSGERIGPFRVLETLGEGGMGTVYLAEQDNPRRTVALKVIRGGAASESLMRRFELEAAALARLQHPGIAQIYQAGTAGDGARRRPYFAMELVRGRPLTEHARGLGVRARLELLIRVAEAVQHAHMKGVVHRDLKPANILVDEAGVPKILDFGVARLTDSDLRVTTMQTGVGQLVGTLPYMSPEQVGSDPLAVDTRSDVYALGVILFELLTGRLPYDLAQRSVPEAVRLIQDAAPARLSSVARVLRGDLDTIAAKALEKDRQRRYQSASDLAADLRRYLASEPILARPPSAVYQLRKFAARNRVLVGAVAVVFLALLGAVVGVTIQRDRALTEAAKATAVTQFLVDMLGAVDPARARGEEVTVRQALDGAAAIIARTPARDREVDATIRHTIGDMYWRIGALDDAERALTDAAEVSARRLGEEHETTLAALNDLALVYKDQGHPEKAGPLIMRVYQARVRSLGEEHPDTLSSMNNASRWLGTERRWDEAIPLMQRVVEVRSRVLGTKDRRTLCSIDNLGKLLFQKGDLEAAERIYRPVIEDFVRELGEDDPDTLVAVHNLAELLHRKAQAGGSSDGVMLAEAERWARRGSQGRLKVFGADNSYTMQTDSLLGRILRDQGRDPEAEPILGSVAERARRVFPPDNPRRGDWILHHAECLEALGRSGEAEGAFLDAYTGLSGNPEGNAARLKTVSAALARHYESHGRPEEAARYREQGER